MPDEAGISRDTEALRGYLAERDVPCPKCNFNLRGGTKPTCPECGEPIRLMVARSEALWTMRRLLVGVVAAQALSYAVFSLQTLWSLLRNRDTWPFLGLTDLVLGVVNTAMMLGLGVVLAMALATFVLRRNRRDERAVSGLLFGFLLTMAIASGWSLAYFAFTFARALVNFTFIPF